MIVTHQTPSIRTAYGELVMNYDTFKGLGFARVCKLLGLEVIHEAA